MSEQQSTALTVADIAAARELITYAKANGWTHYTFAVSPVYEHLWRHDKGIYDRHSAKVSLWQGGVAYYEPDNRDPIATLPARSAAMVTDWLRLLGLISPVLQLGICDACGVDLDRVEAGIAEHMADECVPADER